MSEDEQITGVSDNAYNLSSVLFHAAEGGQVYDKYIEDAERSGHEEVDTVLPRGARRTRQARPASQVLACAAIARAVIG